MGKGRKPDSLSNRELVKSTHGRKRTAPVKPAGAKVAAESSVILDADSLLTEDERRFVAAYTIHWSIIRAALSIGYKDRTEASRQGHHIFNRPHVQWAIREVNQKDLDHLQMSREKLLTHLYWSATRDPIDLVDLETGLLDLNDLRKLPPRIRCCIESIEFTEVTNENGTKEQKVKLKLTNKLQALEMAMRHKGLFANDGDSPIAKLDLDQLYEDQKNAKDPLEELLTRQEPEEPNVEEM